MEWRSKDRFRVLAFGDSLTEGFTDFGLTFHPYGLRLREELAAGLPSTTSVTIDIQGRSGDRVLAALQGSFTSRLKSALTAIEHDLVIILGGTNDLAFRFSAGNAGADEIFHDGLKPLYQHVLETTDASLIVVTVPERALDTRKTDQARRGRAAREHLNDLMRAWVVEQRDPETKTQRVFLMDLAPLIPYPPDKGEDDTTPFDETIWFPDGLHMSASGYDHVGSLLAQMILGLLGEKEAS